VPTWEETKTQGGRRIHQRKAAGGFINARRQAETKGVRGNAAGAQAEAAPVGGFVRRVWRRFRLSTDSVCGGWVGGASPLGGTGGGMRENTDGGGAWGGLHGGKGGRKRRRRGGG